MNAYELADAIEDWDSDGQWDTPAANMLRQQADRIGVLEANYKIQVNIVEKQQDYIDQLEQGLRSSIDLNKSQVDKAIKQADRIAELEKQTKPLSDEDIEDLAGYAGENPTKSDMIAFARAIEERHGIK